MGSTSFRRTDTEIRWTASHSAGRLNTPDLRVFFNNFDTATVVTSTVFAGLDTTYNNEDILVRLITSSTKASSMPTGQTTPRAP